MIGVEKVYWKNKVIAILFRNNIKVKELEFFTDNSNSFQVGAHNRKKGVKLTPHVHHLKRPITIKDVQEWLLVTSGKIRVTLYTKKGEIIKKFILTSGDSILLMSEGHGVDFLEDSTVFEIKQGPFEESVHSKIFLK